MTTWNDLKDYIRRNYTIADEQDNRIKLIFNVGGMRSQVVLVYRQALLDGQEEWFSVESPVGPLDQVDLRAALRHVGGFVCGALATLGDDLLVLRHSAPISDLNIAEFERPLGLVVNSADQLEQKFVGGDDF